MAPAHAEADHYYVPHSSPWPLYGSITLFTLMSGAVATLNGWMPAWALLPGFTMLALLFIFWFHTVIGENQQGLYNLQVDRSFRMGMMWFIFSEVMFFAAFFGALFYARALSVPWIGGVGDGALTNYFLWNGYTPAWPTNGPAHIGGTFEVMPAWGVPLLNTLILLTSGVTITIAHHALRAGHRAQLLIWLGATVLLGALFLDFQAHEYIEAYTKMNLTLGSGIY